MITSYIGEKRIAGKRRYLTLENHFQTYIRLIEHTVYALTDIHMR
jgi:hypothetical protein